MNIYKHLKLTLSEELDSGEELTKKQQDLLALLKDANKELEQYYAGKYKFSISDDIKETPDDLKLSPKRKRKIKEIWLKFDSELSKLQRQYNSFLQNSIDDNKNE